MIYSTRPGNYYQQSQATEARARTEAKRLADMMPLNPYQVQTEGMKIEVSRDATGLSIKCVDGTTLIIGQTTLTLLDNESNKVSKSSITIADLKEIAEVIKQSFFGMLRADQIQFTEVVSNIAKLVRTTPISESYTEEQKAKAIAELASVYGFIGESYVKYDSEKECKIGELKKILKSSATGLLAGGITGLIFLVATPFLPLALCLEIAAGIAVGGAALFAALTALKRSKVCKENNYRLAKAKIAKNLAAAFGSSSPRGGGTRLRKSKKKKSIASKKKRKTKTSKKKRKTKTSKKKRNILSKRKTKRSP